MPIFTTLLLGLLLAEVCASVLGKRKIFDFRMTTANLAAKKLRVLAVLPVVPVEALYVWLFRHTTPLHLPWARDSVVSWAAALLLMDFGFYVYHVSAHRWNLLWSSHVVHHQSTDFNMSLSGRDGLLESLFLAMFYLPLAVIGLPPLLEGTALTIVLLLMGTAHCNVIGRLGPLEWIFNTPSHHRVHHCRDLAEHGTRNFGAVLIVWDRLFGTFLGNGGEERAIGVTHQAPLYDPWLSQIYYFRHLIRQVWRAPMRDKAGLLFGAKLPEPPAEPAAGTSGGNLGATLTLLLAIDLLAALFLRFARLPWEGGGQSWTLLTGIVAGLIAAGLLLGRQLTGRGNLAVAGGLGVAGVVGIDLGFGAFHGELLPGLWMPLASFVAYTALVGVALRFTPPDTRAKAGIT